MSDDPILIGLWSLLMVSGSSFIDDGAVSVDNGSLWSMVLILTVVHGS